MNGCEVPISGANVIMFEAQMMTNLIYVWLCQKFCFFMRRIGMTGYEYEQFVRAVLIERLGIPSKKLISTRTSGATLPNARKLHFLLNFDLAVANLCSETSEFLMTQVCES
jgi:hypothetical protein